MLKNTIRISGILVSTLIATALCLAQPGVGIGTLSPDRLLEISGTGDQHVRMRSQAGWLGTSGIELLRGGANGSILDWRISNYRGDFTISSGDYDFATSSNEHIRINSDDEFGIGTSAPNARLHVDGGEHLSFGDAGYFRVGGTNHLVFDAVQLMARSGDEPSDLHIQSHGGNTYVSHQGGDVFIPSTQGVLYINTESTPGIPVSVEDDGFQVLLNNDGDGSVNSWYVGASGPSWTVGADQLLFSSENNSSSSTFRLGRTYENNGSIAPVMIRSTGAQLLLIDNNEIDAANGDLYINNNSGEDTYFNTNGGKVAIASNTPANSVLTIDMQGSPEWLSMQRNNWRWRLDHAIAGDLTWKQGILNMAQVNASTGAWSSLSDQKFKKDIQPMGSALTAILKTGAYRYSFNHDAEERQYIGVLAQEVRETIPEVVVETEGQLGVAYGQLAVHAIRAIQEQQEVISDLQNRIVELKKQLQEQEYSNSIK